MTPFMAFIIVVWSNGPLEMNNQSEPIYQEVFPDKQICEIALEEKLKDVMPLYMARPETRKVISACVPATGKDA